MFKSVAHSDRFFPSLNFKDFLNENIKSSKFFIFKKYVYFRFFVRICRDVLLQILIFGNRHCLTKLEFIGKRVHRTIEHYYKKSPCLRYDFEIDSGYF